MKIHQKWNEKIHIIALRDPLPQEKIEKYREKCLHKKQKKFIENETVGSFTNLDIEQVVE